MSKTTQLPLWTGQLDCYNEQGALIECKNSGQDAEYKTGNGWPDPRFILHGDMVQDALSGLYWTRRSNFAEFPLSWQEALDFVCQMNRRAYLGYNDWRLPNRRELHSLLSFQQSRPALPVDHLFDDVFPAWYWTSTSAAISPDHAWYVHLEGARIFYGGKDQSYLVWPVRGEANTVFAATGQKNCYDSKGESIDCVGSGQDGEYRTGCIWPEPRFEVKQNLVLDRLTGLHWARRATLGSEPVTWMDALGRVAELNRIASHYKWRLPTINELESLVDCSCVDPALTADHPFEDIRDIYWSSTTSTYEPDWAWALYMTKGALGVGQKCLPIFYVWPVVDLVYEHP